jgi:peptide/nickel transport system permease protein
MSPLEFTGNGESGDQPISATFIIHRAANIVISLFWVITIIFFLFELLPGDPTAAYADAGFTVAARQMVIERFGLDRPIRERYVIYLRNVVRGDFGLSFFYRRPANQVIFEKVWNTLILTLPATLIAYVIGILGGAVLAWKRGTTIDNVSIILAMALRAAPVFFTGMLALMVFAYGLGWLPHSGMRTPGYASGGLLGGFLTADFLRHLILPTVIAALYILAIPLLLMRNTMLETLSEDYIDYCRAKGLSERRVMYVHACRNALLPVLTSAALAVGTAIGGQVVLEYVFGWPGLGREIVLAAQRSDYPVAQFGLLLLAGMVMILNFAADMLYGYLDPRVRLQ